MGVVTLSDHVRGAVEQERTQVAARLDEIQTQAARLHALVGQVDRDVEETSRLLRQMDEMLGIAPQLALNVDGELRGRELQRVAIELLRSEQGDAVGAPVHYRAWYELVVAAGGRVAG